MNWYRLFYWITVAENAKVFFIVFTTVFSVISVIATLVFIFGRDDGGKCPKDGWGERAKKWMWWGYPFMIFFWGLFIFTPNKKDTLLIIAGGGTMNFLTTDSVSKQIPRELSTFVVSELKNMAKEAEVDLGVLTQKDKILDEAKKMSTEQLLEKMQVDSNFAKIITGR